MARRLPLSDECHASRRPVLQELYDDISSPHATANALASMAASDPELRTGLPCIGTGLNNTWGFMLCSARELPSQHERLVDVMVCLSHFDHVRDDGEVEMVHGARVWRDLPMFGWELNGQWNGEHERPEGATKPMAMSGPVSSLMVLDESWNMLTPIRPGLDIPPQPGPERDQKAWLFLNVNRFTARLMLTLEPVFNYEMFALWTMRAALETPTEQATFRRECPEVFVPAAAAWILILGPQIYQWDKEFDHGPRVGAPGGGGPLWAGKHGFCVERWLVWRSRFEEMAGSLGVFTAEVRASAGQAATRMRQVEAGEV